MTDLSDKLRTLGTHEATKAADDFDEAVEKAFSDEGTPENAKRLLGCWARARRVWCDATGEPLV